MDPMPIEIEARVTCCLKLEAETSLSMGALARSCLQCRGRNHRKGIRPVLTQINSVSPLNLRLPTINVRFWSSRERSMARRLYQRGGRRLSEYTRAKYTRYVPNDQPTRRMTLLGSGTVGEILCGPKYCTANCAQPQVDNLFRKG